MEYAFDARHHWERVSSTESRVEIELDLNFDFQKNTSVEQVRRELFGTLANKILSQIGKDAPTVARHHNLEHIKTDDEGVTIDFDISSDSKEKWKEGNNGINGVVNGKVFIALKSDQPIAPADAFQIARAGIADNLATGVATSYSSFLNGATSAESKVEAAWKGKKGEGSLKTATKTKVTKDGAV